MRNKQTAVQEAIDLIKQDYEANGRLRLAYVLQTLNKAKEKEKQQVMESYGIGFNDGCSYMFDGKTEYNDLEGYYTETYGGQNNDQ